ncbi:MAG: NAD(P)-binding domain-containing protein [Anaerolineae bacterium]
MNIGIVGAGSVGVSFAKAVRRLNHSVMLSSRTPDSEKMRALSQELNAQTGTVAETVAFGHIVVVALRWDAVPDAVREGGDWSGKVIVDLTNRFGSLPSGVTSGAAALAQLTGGKVVKAFNSIGAEHYQHPSFSGQSATMPIAGDDPTAKAEVMQLAQAMGFDPIDFGGLEHARLVENWAEIWVHLAFRAGQGRDIALKLIRRT